jgi:uncharacterized membrane protein YphA (DoxX/SURF4 family)
MPERREFDLNGWVLRGGVALFFVLVGAEKFQSGPAAQFWVTLFQQIGFGQWFRYFTGFMEVSGALLYLFPKTNRIGAAMLVCTMLGAMAVHIVIRHSIGDSVFPLIFLVAVVLVAIRRPDDPPEAIARRMFPPRKTSG